MPRAVTAPSTAAVRNLGNRSLFVEAAPAGRHAVRSRRHLLRSSDVAVARLDGKAHLDSCLPGRTRGARRRRFPTTRRTPKYPQRGDQSRHRAAGELARPVAPRGCRATGYRGIAVRCRAATCRRAQSHCCRTSVPTDSVSGIDLRNGASRPATCWRHRPRHSPE